LSPLASIKYKLIAQLVCAFLFAKYGGKE